MIWLAIANQRDNFGLDPTGTQQEPNIPTACGVGSAHTMATYLNPKPMGAINFFQYYWRLFNRGHKYLMHRGIALFKSIDWTNMKT